MDPAMIEQGKPAKRWLGQLFVEWFSTSIWCRITDGRCKEYISYYKKLATETIQIQHEERQGHWGQAWDKPHQQQVQWHEHEHAQDAQHLSMNESAHPITRLMLGHMHFLAQVLSPIMSSMYMCVSLWVHLSHSLLRSVLHHPLPLLPSHALRAVHWAWQFDRHAKLAQLREQGE